MRSQRGILTCTAIILFMAAIAVSAVNSHKTQINEERNAAVTPAPSVRTLTLTATGDCTLATDITTPQEGSFEAKVEEVNNDYSYFLENFAAIFAEDDVTVVNFEGTLSENGTREDKTFAFRGDPAYVGILTSASVEAANLANNHSHDYGDISFTDTQNTLTAAGIINFAGSNTAVKNINGINVGFVGINALNDEGKEQLEPMIKQVKADGAELVILSIHWGEELEEVPNDEQKSLAHTAVDAGADIVLGTHPHVIQGVEKYNGRYIMYSLGNFCFGGNTNPTDMDTMLVRAVLTLDENGNLVDDDNISFIPARVSSTDEYNDYKPIAAEGDERLRIIEKIEERTAAISDLQLTFR